MKEETRVEQELSKDRKGRQLSMSRLIKNSTDDIMSNTLAVLIMHNLRYNLP
jgi:hypothetical protein